MQPSIVEPNIIGKFVQVEQWFESPFGTHSLTVEDPWTSVRQVKDEREKAGIHTQQHPLHGISFPGRRPKVVTATHLTDSSRIEVEVNEEAETIKLSAFTLRTPEQPIATVTYELWRISGSSRELYVAQSFSGDFKLLQQYPRGAEPIVLIDEKLFERNLRKRAVGFWPDGVFEVG